MTLNSAIYVLRNLNVKTIYFNFKQFSFSSACKIPVFINSKVFLKDIKGKITLPEKVYAGIIKIGYGDIGIFDRYKSRTILEVKGSVQFKGKADIGHGSRISVGENGKLIIGKNFSITAESSIICFKKISFDDNSLLSWGVLIMDTDFHKIYSEEKNSINADREINIGSNVWIGARCTILKGSEIADGCVIAANSLVTGILNKSGCIYAGQPAKIIKEKITWEV